MHPVHKKQTYITYGNSPMTASGLRTRVEWIDIAKGVGIVLVSFCHLPNGDGESVWLPALSPVIATFALFHMPLFYVLGGADLWYARWLQGVSYA